MTDHSVENRLINAAADADTTIRDLRLDKAGLHQTLKALEEENSKLRKGRENLALYIFLDGSTKIARRIAHKGAYLAFARMYPVQSYWSPADEVTTPTYTQRFRIMGEAGPYLVYVEV